MGIKFRHNRMQIVIDGNDAIELAKRLYPAPGAPAKALRIDYANGRETDYKPIITVTVVNK